MSYRDENIGRALLNSILTADGLIMTLSWGLFDWNLPPDIKKVLLCHIKLGSTLLGISLLAGVICFQLMVSTSQADENQSVMKAKHVAVVFFICWVSFLIGIGTFLVGIWRL